MNCRLFFFLSLLPLCGYAFAQTASDEEDVYFILSGEADKAIAEGDYATAALRIREAMDVDPSNPSNVLLLSNLGTVYNYMDQDSLALDAFNKACSIAPGMTTVIENRGRLYLKMGDKGAAYRDFSTVIERDSCNADARYYRGMMALYGGDLRAAEGDFAVLESEYPANLHTSLAMATLYYMTGRDMQAIPFYKKLVEKSPEPEFYAALATCYLAVAELTDASATIAEGLELYPDDPELYYCRARLNRDRYLLKEARADAQRAVDLGFDRRRAAELFSPQK